MIDKRNHKAVMRLPLARSQQRFVSPNAVSIAEGHYHESAWFRAVYLGEEPVGFVMLHDPRCGPDPSGASNPEKQVPEDGLFLWRFMIAESHQGRGLGRQVIAMLAQLTRDSGFQRLYLSYGEGEGGPGPFYARCGFVETGRIIDGETEARLDLA